MPDQVIFLTPKGAIYGKEFNELNLQPKAAEEPPEDFDPDDSSPDMIKRATPKMDTEEDDDESKEETKFEYDPEEMVYQVRVMFGLGKCMDLVFPKSMNNKAYRANMYTPKHKQFELCSNPNLPYRVFQPVSHPQLGGVIFFLTDESPFVLQEAID